MQTGLDQISILKKKIKGKRVGILCHAASVDSRLKHILECLFPSLQRRGLRGGLHARPLPIPFLTKEREFNIVSLFGPEHGIWGVAQDMEHVDSASEPITGLPVHSLYGASLDTLKPKQEWLKNLDCVVCDLQDVGSRYYTFVYSIALMMQACAEAGIEVIVLDRPNPLGGVEVEGGAIQKGYESFVGLYSIANRHGMSVGELAQFFNEEYQMGCKLSVLSLKGWKRERYFDQTKLPWVLPSPNMPSLETAIIYPGLCLLEATEISEGRGTTRPFEIFGAPFVKPEALKKYLEEFKLKGVYFRPLYFKPMFQKLAGEVCGGLQIHVTDRKKLKPYLLGLAILKALKELYPQEFRWREKPYEFVQEIPAIDLLTGSADFRKMIEQARPWKEIVGNYENGKKEFLRKRKEYLIYK